MAPLAKNGGPQKKSWTAVAVLALFIMGFLAAGAFARVSDGTGTSSSTDTTAASSGSTTDTTPASSSTDTTSTTTPTSTDTTTTASTSTDTTTTTPTDTSLTTTSTATTTTTTTSSSPLTPTITSDKADYSPGSTVTLTGSGWGAGEAVHIFVNDTIGQTWSYSADVTADATGGFTNQFQLPNTFISDYDVTATGAAGEKATTTFTDAGPASNGEGTMSVTPTPVNGGSTNTFTFTFTSPTSKDFNAGSQVSVVVPAGWTAPTTAAGAGHTTVAAGPSPNCTAAVLHSITGTGPWTILVDMTCPAKDQFTITYASAVAPTVSTATDYQFTTQSKQNGGTLTNIAVQPKVTVNPTSTTTGVTSSANPSTYGTSQTLAATVTPSPGTNGVVTFHEGGTTYCASVSLSGGTATCALPTTLSAGSHPITADYSGGGAFSSSSGSITQTVSQKAITGSFTAANKVYDGTTTASVTGTSLNGLVGSDIGNVTLVVGTATFATKNVGTGITVTGSALSLVGSAATNYTLTSVSTTNASITAKSISGNFTAADKIYDGTNAASISTRTLTGAIGGDAVSLTGGTATFSDKNVGNTKTVTGTGFSLTGADAGNYTLASSTLTTTANITPASLTGSFTAANKVYDGTTSATITGRSLIGVLGTDSVTLTGGTATFVDKNIGAAKTVTATGFSLTGTDAGNYTLASTTLTTTANITALSVTASFTAANKVYDGTTAATITNMIVTGAISGDHVNLVNGTATFSDKNVGAGKTVTWTGYKLTGSDSGNYVLGNTTATTTANITAAPVTGSFTAANKVYDAMGAATILTRSLSGVISPDVVNLSGGSASFSDKSVGTGKTVTGTGFSLTGADAGNYALSSTTLTTTANITPASLTGSFTASDKTYDGTTSASIATRSLSGVLGTDNVTLAGGTATFSDKNVGIGKTVTGSGFTLGGSDAGNYSLSSSTLTTTASITTKTLTGSFTAANKTYDGTTAATISTRSLSSVIAPDVVSLSGGTASFSDKHVGNSKTVTGTGFSLTGADAGNYTLGSVSTATANITPLTISGSFTAANKVYDGNTAATILTRSLSGAIGGDDVSLAGGTATFSDKSVGVGKTVSGSGFSLSGADAGNYILGSVVTTTANITPLTITGSFTAANKAYDTTTAATITGQSLNGAIVGDFVSVSGGTASFSDPNVGNGKTVTGTGFSLSGTDAGNYALGSVSTTTANITGAALSISAASDTKTYDASTSSTGAPTVAGLKGGDTVTGKVQNFDSRHVGARTLSVTAYTVNDGNSGKNYVVTLHTASGSITPAALTISAVSDTKAYDSTTTSAAIPAVSGLKGSDTVSGQTQSFDSRHVGVRTLSVNPGFTVNDGNGGADYTVSTPTTSGSITPAPLTIAAIADTKTYDSTTSSGKTPSVSGLKGTDTVSGQTQAFDSRHAGPRTLSVTAYTVNDGNSGHDYSVSTPTAAGSITPAPLTIAAVTDTKVYDSTTTSGKAPTVSGLLGSDTVSGQSQAFDSRHVGSRTLSVTGYTVNDGNSGHDYNVSTPTAAGSITPASLTIAAVTDTKVYDTTTSSSGTPTVSGLKGPDTVTGLNQGFASKNVLGPNGSTLQVTGDTVNDGNSGHDYSVSTPTAAGTINPAHLTVKANDQSMILNGTVPALTYTTTGFAGSETLATSGVTGAASCSTANGTAVGKFPITCTIGTLAAQNYDFPAGNFAQGWLTVTYATGTAACNGSTDPSRTVLQPVNPDGSSVFKKGSTAPIKFRVCDAKGNSIGPGTNGAGIVTGTGAPVFVSSKNGSGPVDETVYSTTPDTAFRWSSTDQQWIFNQNLGNLVAGNVYTFTIPLNDGTNILYTFGVK